MAWIPLSSIEMEQLRQLSRYSDGIRAGRHGFSSRQGQDFSLLHTVQTGSGALPASSIMGIGISFPGGKAGLA
jgi:hypothetical protein